MAVPSKRVPCIPSVCTVWGCRWARRWAWMPIIWRHSPAWSSASTLVRVSDHASFARGYWRDPPSLMHAADLLPVPYTQ